MFPSEPPEQKSEAGNSLLGQGAHFMRSLWPWTDTGLGQVQAAAIHTHFMGGGGGGEEPATQDLPANHLRMQAVTRCWKGPE